MNRLIATFLAAAISLHAALSQADQAYDFTGVDDPSLQRALDAYLNGEALEPITELAALARDGNVAARLLLWRLETRMHDDLPGLSREDRWRLYRAPADGGRPKRWSESAELRDHPFVVDWHQVAREKDPEIWLDHARRMVAAGEREHVLQSSMRRLQQHPYLAEFVGEATTIGDDHQLGVWYTRWIAHLAAKMPAGSAPDYWFEGWTGPPWGAEHEIVVQKAFADKRLSALAFLRLRNPRPGTPAPGDVLVDRTYDRLVELMFWLKGGVFERSPPTPAERIAAGALLVAEARKGTYLKPLLDICEAHCAPAVEACMYSGVVHAGGRSVLSNYYSPFEALIPQQRWRNSVRARQDVLRHARAHQDKREYQRTRGDPSVGPESPPGGCFAQLLAD